MSSGDPAGSGLAARYGNQLTYMRSWDQGGPTGKGLMTVTVTATLAIDKSLSFNFIGSGAHGLTATTAVTIDLTDAVTWEPPATTAPATLNP